MSAGSRTYLVPVSYTVIDFRGARTQISNQLFAESWNFPSPRKKPRNLQPTAAFMSRTTPNLSGINRTVGAGLSRVEYVGAPPSVALSTGFKSRTTSASSDHLATLALSRARSNFSTGDVNVGNMLGEAKSSAKMIVERAGKLAKFVDDFQSMNWKAIWPPETANKRLSEKRQKEIKALKKSKRFANAHLELMFGWLPLLSDLYSLSDALSSSFREKGTSVRRSSRRSQGGLTGKAGVTGIVTNPFLRSLSELGLLNPLSVAWELVPFSFFLDYLGTIGEYLNGITAGLGMSDVWQWKTVETLSFDLRSGTSGTFAYPETVITTRLSVARTVDPLAALEGPITFRELTFSLARASTTIALIVQRIK